MFDEISTQSADYQAPRQPDAPTHSQRIEKVVSEVLVIEQQSTEFRGQEVYRFLGYLSMDSELAFEHLRAQLKPLGYQAHMTTDDDDEKHLVLVMHAMESPQPRSWMPNAVLLVLTIFSTMFAGATISGSISSFEELLAGGILKGLPYTFSVMLILGGHELGHYFAARHHKVSVTLPYFIPFPFGFFGTLGAFIQLREPMRNRRQLFDIGISGPLTGLIFAVPILILGVATAEVNALPTEQDCRENPDECAYILEGNSVFYAAVKYIIHGDWLPNDLEDMTINQLSFAGWTGLFVTGLNLMPVGQLDGGHILYTLIGKHARKVYLPGLIIMGLLALYNNGWILWVLLLFFFGRTHAVPMNDITPLDRRRQILGYVTLAIFFLIFTPSPFTFVNLN